MADENKSKDVLVHADHVKVYFKGKDKKSGTVRAVDDISFDIFAGETSVWLVSPAAERVPWDAP